MFIKLKIFRRPVLCYGLIDTGNLALSLINEDFAKRLKLPISPVKVRLRTPNANGVDVVGRVSDDLLLWIEHVNKPLRIRPLVVKNLIYPLNIGSRALASHQMSIEFDTSGTALKVGDKRVLLSDPHTSLLTPSYDPRFLQVQNLCRDAKIMPRNDFTCCYTSKQNTSNSSQSQPSLSQVDLSHTNTDTTATDSSQNDHEVVLNFNQTKHRAYSYSSISIPPKSTSQIPIEVKVFNGRTDASSSVYFTPEVNRKYLLEKDVLGQEGVYSVQNNQAKILLHNLSDHPVHIAAGIRLGVFSTLKALEPVLEHTVNQIDPTLTPPSISEKELKYRREYIMENLNLGEGNLTMEQEGKFRALFLKYWDAISTGGHDLGHTTLGECVIELKEGAQPFKASTRPLNPALIQDLKRQISEWELAGVIEPSKSPWSSPLVPVRKKNSSTYRWAVDFRRLNSVTITDSFPLPRCEESLNALAGSCIFTCLDSAGAFHTVPVENASRPLTTFCSPLGLWQFARMPFGIVNGPAIYSRIVQRAMAHLPDHFLVIYLDDIIVHSKTIEEHLIHLEKVLDAHLRAGMKLKLAKCHVAKSSVDYLGHTVSKEGIQMNQDYVERVLSWPLPQSAADLRSFLGVAGYYRAFIPEFAKLTAEMQTMKNHPKPGWTDVTREKFQTLKSLFASAPVRSFPDFSKTAGRFILETDWSKEAKAAVLLQEHPDGVDRFIGACAHKCNVAERNYSANKGEMSALIMGLRKWEHILSYKPFLSRTDNAALTWLRNHKENRGIYSRWNDTLALFRFDCEHKPGKKNVFADALSRRTDNPPGEPEPEDVEILDVYMVIPEEGDGSREHSIITPDRWRQETVSDPNLSIILQRLQDQRPFDKEEKKEMNSVLRTYADKWEQLTVDQGVVYLREPRPWGWIRRVCLPDNLLYLALSWAHYDRYAGHFGISKTTSRIQDRFYIPNISNFVKEMISNCPDCLQKHKAAFKKNHPPYHRILQRFGEMVFVDIVGPLGNCIYRGERCSYVATMLDGFTRYLEAVPIPNQEAKTVAKAFLDHWVSKHGVPSSIHSDNGRQYTSKLWSEMVRLLGIQHTFTPPYSPEGNRVERVHRTLGNLLRTDDTGDRADWISKLFPAVLAINTTVNRVTGVSPYFAVYGRNCNLPIDLVLSLPTDPVDLDATNDPQRFGLNMRAKFRRIYQYMISQQDAEVARDVTQHTRTIENMKIRVGDQVYYFSNRAQPGLATKLQRRWIGPYVVNRIYSPSLVILRPVDPTKGPAHEIPAIVNRLARIDPHVQHKYQIANSYPTFQEMGNDLQDEGLELNQRDLGVTEDVPSVQPRFYGGAPRCRIPESSEATVAQPIPPLSPPKTSDTKDPVEMEQEETHPLRDLEEQMDGIASPPVVQDTVKLPTPDPEPQPEAIEMEEIPESQTRSLLPVRTSSVPIPVFYPPDPTLSAPAARIQDPDFIPSETSALTILDTPPLLTRQRTLGLTTQRIDSQRPVIRVQVPTDLPEIIDSRVLRKSIKRGRDGTEPMDRVVKSRVDKEEESEVPSDQCEESETNTNPPPLAIEYLPDVEDLPEAPVSVSSDQSHASLPYRRESDDTSLNSSRSSRQTPKMKRFLRLPKPPKPYKRIVDTREKK